MTLVEGTQVLCETHLPQPAVSGPAPSGRAVPGPARRGTSVAVAGTHPGAGAAQALVEALLPLVSAEALAEAPAAAIEPADLEQGVWVRLLERLQGEEPPKDAARWVRSAVRAEARRARRTAARELPYVQEPAAEAELGPEQVLFRAERRRVLRAAVSRTPGRCPPLLTAMLSPKDPTYREIAGELGISQGSLGPMRSRCLGCLRRMLGSEVAAPELGGKER